MNKFLNREDITPLLERLVTVTALPLRTVETDFAIDSSGFRTTSFNEYNKMKHDTRKHHRWLEAHICVGVKTNIITRVKAMREKTPDSPQFEPLVKITSESGFNIGEVSADLGYSSRRNYDVVNEVGGQAFIPFKSNARGLAKGSPLWKKMFYYFKLNQEEFLEHYHKRSNVETTFHMIKMKLGDKLKSKNFVAQKNELLCKIIAHNIIVVIHEIYELGIEPNFCS